MPLPGVLPGELFGVQALARPSSATLAGSRESGNLTNLYRARLVP